MKKQIIFSWTEGIEVITFWHVESIIIIVKGLI